MLISRPYLRKVVEVQGLAVMELAQHAVHDPDEVHPQGLGLLFIRVVRIVRVVRVVRAIRVNRVIGIIRLAGSLRCNNNTSMQSSRLEEADNCRAHSSRNKKRR